MLGRGGTVANIGVAGDNVASLHRPFRLRLLSVWQRRQVLHDVSVILMDVANAAEAERAFARQFDMQLELAAGRLDEPP